MPTQAERSATTREALIKASAALLLEQGYAAFGEARVCDRAGTSRGSLRYHFPQGRYDLLPAMIAWLLDAEAQQLAALGPLSSSQRLHLTLHALLHRRPRNTSVVILEVWMASRGDTRLADAVGPLLATVPELLFGQTPAAPAESEWLVLRCFLGGTMLHSFASDYDPDRMVRAAQWLLARLEPPPGMEVLLARLEAGNRPT